MTKESRLCKITHLLNYDTACLRAHLLNLTREIQMQQTIHETPEILLQNLIRFDTSNPPGNEYDCINYIKDVLEAYQIPVKIIAKDPKRPNLYARLNGEGKKPPLLLFGHVDVVPAKEENWKYPPFEGAIKEDFVWGRGALDMKGADAMMLAAILTAKVRKLSLPGDVILCFTSDEEDKSDCGARFLVEEHAALFEGCKYGISEFGGFPLFIGGKTFYPIEVEQKQICRLKVTITGPTGHGSTLVENSAASKLAGFLARVTSKKLPLHFTPTVKMMFKKMAKHAVFPFNLIFYSLLSPTLNPLLFSLLGKQSATFAPFFHNIINPTMINGGSSINVIPGTMEVKFDGRLLPGFGPDDLVKELKNTAPGFIEKVEVIQFEESSSARDMTLFPLLEDILQQADPQAVALPFVLPASSDARFFSRLGIQTYGFTPMLLPREIDLLKCIHSENERIPLKALQSGTDMYLKLLKSF